MIVWNLQIPVPPDNGFSCKSVTVVVQLGKLDGSSSQIMLYFEFYYESSAKSYYKIITVPTTSYDLRFFGKFSTKLENSSKSYGFFEIFIVTIWW